MKQPITNSPATATGGGRMDRPKFTVLSTPPARLHRAGKTAGKNENQAHYHDVFVAHALGNAFKLFAEFPPGILHEGNHQSNQEPYGLPGMA